MSSGNIVENIQTSSPTQVTEFQQLVPSDFYTGLHKSGSHTHTHKTKKAKYYSEMLDKQLQCLLFDKHISMALP